MVYAAANDGMPHAFRGELTGMAHATVLISDLTDGTVDAIYVGDLSGQFWRFDVTVAAGTAAAYPDRTVTRLMRASDARWATRSII
ncbi:hypothetical protein [Variovorax sp. UC74_104]|uniref:hypothetical protein n=1 Tax=Variovorax sp. UC74_104 TaxID=3374555 RepID=UPI00375683F1